MKMIKAYSAVIFILLTFFIAEAQQGQADFEQAQRLLIDSPAKSEAILNQIIAQSSSTTAPDLKGNAHRLLASLYATHSRKKEEIEHLFRSYWYFKDGGNTREQAEAERLIGNYYLHMNLLKEAQTHFSEGIGLAGKERDTVTLIKITSNLAQLAGKQNEYDKAIKLYQDAILLSNKIQYKRGLLENWNRLSYAYRASSHPDKALACSKKAISYKTQNSDTLGILFGDLGLAYLESAEYDSAAYFLNSGLQLIRRGKNRIQEMVLAKFLSRLKEKQHDFHGALEYIKLHDSLSASIFNEQLKNEVGFAETKYRELATEVKLQKAIEHDRKLLIALVIGVIGFVFMVIILFWMRSRNREVRRQKNELDQTLNTLREREGLLQQLFDNSPTFILTHTIEGEILSANHLAQSDLLLGEERFKGKPVLNFIPGIDKEQFKIFSKNLQEQGSRNGWLQVENKQGSIRTLRYQSKLVQTENRAPYVITFALDDTEIYNVRREREIERRRLVSVLENSPDGYAILTKEGMITYMNRSNFFEAKDAVGKNMSDFIDSDSSRIFFRNLNEVFEKGELAQYEQSFKDKIFLIKLIPVFSTGAVQEVLSINTDITEIRNREENVKELNRIIETNERRFRNLVEGSMVLICAHDLEGNLLTVNTPGAASMGYLPEELIRKRLDEFIPEEFKQEFTRYIDGIKRDGVYEGFLTIRRKDGERRIFLCRNVLLRDENMVLGSAQDVTEWKKAEFREKQTRKELQKAKEEAEESNRLKTVFLGSLSHEVRTPLQGILGFAEILEDSSLPEYKRLEYLHIIKRRAGDMENIIEALLDMASVESGEIKAFPVVLNLHEFADHFFAKLNQDYPPQKPINLILENKLSVNAMACLDVQHLNQTLLNLTRNAIKFTEAGSITMLFENCHKGGYKISVADTGIGIPPDKLDQIFKPFRQAHEGISRSKGGIGLGLSISKKFAELWGGEIIVSSQAGEGSTFSIMIPGG